MSRKNVHLPLPSGATGITAVKYLEETVDLADFTDGGGAAGTYTMAGDLPKDSVFIAAHVKVPAAFAGNVSAVLTIGDGSDVDRYNTGTPSVFAAAPNGVAMGIPSGAKVQLADVSPVLTVTASADFTAVTGGQLIVRLYYV